jgi:hypothetical protein
VRSVFSGFVGSFWAQGLQNRFMYQPPRSSAPRRHGGHETLYTISFSLSVPFCARLLNTAFQAHADVRAAHFSAALHSALRLLAVRPWEPTRPRPER